MGLFDEIKKKLSNEFIDIVEYADHAKNSIVYRFERYQNEIKNGAQLIVREGQKAVFVSEGKLADVFEPGTYTLNTKNLPILSTIKGWKYGFNSPFKAEVYFVATTIFVDEKWGTKNPIVLNDERFGLVEIRAFGTYNFRIIDAGTFIKDIVGVSTNFTNFEINEHLKSLIASRFTDTVGEANIPIELYAANTSELSETCLEVMKPEFAEIGIGLEKFILENVSMPEDLKKEIFEYSRMDTIDLDKLTKFKTAKAIEAAAKNEGGLAGGGMGMGLGFAMAQQMSQAIQPNQMPNTVQPYQTNQGNGNIGGSATNTPPPIPQTVQYFYAVDGQQQGPVTFEILRNLFAGRTVNRDTLVWKQGMANWTALKEVEELKVFLGGNTPPPLPPTGA